MKKKNKYLGYAPSKKKILLKKKEFSKKGYGNIKVINMGYSAGSPNYALWGRKKKKK